MHTVKWEFSLNWPLGWFSPLVAISTCLGAFLMPSVFFQGLLLANSSHRITFQGCRPFQAFSAVFSHFQLQFSSVFKRFFLILFEQSSAILNQFKPFPIFFSRFLTFLTVYNYVQPFSNVFNYHQQFSNISNLYQRLSTVLKHFQQFSSVSNRF